MVLVRDTADRDGGTLAFSAAAWQRFLGTVASWLPAAVRNERQPGAHG